MIWGWHTRLSRRQRQKCQSYSRYLLVFLIIAVLYQVIRRRRTDATLPLLTQPQRPRHPRIKQLADYWRSLFGVILNNDPACLSPPEFVTSSSKLDVSFDPNHTPLRPDVLWIQADDLEKLKAAHRNFVSSIRNELPSPFYNAQTRGIVMTAGAKQLPVLTISLRMLRRSGCTLPVEVFLASVSDYDPTLCGEILSSLNAQCFVIQDILDFAGTGVHLEHFQYKVVAVLFSSFEDILLLDSDNFPTVDPVPLFDSLPFNQTGMILWPDFWYASESPYFFEIASLGPPPPLNTKPSTESGQVLMSKTQHNLTLALAAYYNYYGPQIYYPLQSQGGPGQGDKESFGWAATVMQEDFYTVRESVLALGHSDSNGRYVGSAMAQHNPTTDYELAHHDADGAVSGFSAPIARPQAATTSNITGHRNGSTKSSKPLFIHANFPKFDPSTIFSTDTQAPGEVGPCFDSNGTAVRAWLPQRQMEELFGYDVEKVFWQEIEYVACQYEDRFAAFREKGNVCEQTRRYTEAVFGGFG